MVRHMEHWDAEFRGGMESTENEPCTGPGTLEGPQQWRNIRAIEDLTMNDRSLRKWEYLRNGLEHMIHHEEHGKYTNAGVTQLQ